MNAGVLVRLFAIALVLSLVPYLLLACHAHPVADDYCYAAKSAGQSLWAWSKGEWLYWNGRYTSNLLMNHGPLSWSRDFLPGYRAMAVALLALTYFSAWFLLRRATRHALSTRHELLAALAYLLLYLQLMPDLGEGFYWYTGAITYQLGSILLLLHLALLFPGQDHRESVPRLLLNLLLAVAITGMDEIHMLMMVGFHLGRTTWLITQHKGTLSPLLLLLASVAGAALMALAPGNAIRGAMFADTHLLGWSLGMGALQAVRFMGTWLLSPTLLAFCLLYIPVHGPLRKRIPGYAKLLQLPWWLAAFLPFLLVLATTFPAYWSTGLLGQHRTINVACLFFIPLVFLNLGIWLERGVSRQIQAAEPPPVLMGAAMLLAILSLHLAGNGAAANADLLSGRATTYDQVLTQREISVRAAAEHPETTITFVRLAHPPRTLPNYENLFPLRDWMMHCQARYFGAEEHQVEMAGQ